MAESSYTQNAQVTINKHNTSFKEILREIEQQTDYLFIYNNDVRDETVTSLKTKHKAVSEVLNELLEEQNLYYLMEGNHIVLFSKDSSEMSQAKAAKQKKNHTKS